MWQGVPTYFVGLVATHVLHLQEASVIFLTELQKWKKVLLKNPCLGRIWHTSNNWAFKTV